MNAPAAGNAERDALRRRMLACAAVAERLAAPGDLSTLGSRMLASLSEDVDALAVYLSRTDQDLRLVLQAGCPQPPPAHAPDARALCGVAPCVAAQEGGACIVALGPARPAWIGARSAALAAVPFDGAGQERRGLALFMLRQAEHAPSLAALLELAAHKLSQALERDPAPLQERSGADGAKTRVLLIDDEALLVAHVRRILERAGFAFHASQSARAGFALAMAIHPDVILIDKVMPDLDGIKLLRMMRGHEALRTVPVIMLSGQADETARIAALGEGADDFVVKPFSAKDLVARIEANVRLVRVRRDAVWREGELLRLRQSQRELRTLLDTVQRVRDDERRMLAREVHDQLGQILTAAKIDIRLLQDRVAHPERPPSADAILAELSAALKSVDLAIAAVQDIAALLRPPELEAGLVAALRWQAADLQRRTGIACHVLHDPDDYVEQPPFVSGELLRICQEALTNVLRHAGASRVVIQVAMRRASLLVRVCDDGGGIPRGRLHDAASLGLKGMRERAASIRASISVYGRPGRGSMVSIRRRLAYR
ncbi:response regulator [Massilia suwonensis]|uniref:Response regulator n=1 Tax=Massilia suwonensis TaxID=648895 RepID=A0ABW0MRM1_9BURK